MAAPRHLAPPCKPPDGMFRGEGLTPCHFPCDDVGLVKLRAFRLQVQGFLFQTHLRDDYKRVFKRTRSSSTEAGIFILSVLFQNMSFSETGDMGDEGYYTSYEESGTINV